MKKTKQKEKPQNPNVTFLFKITITKKGIEC